MARLFNFTGRTTGILIFINLAVLVSILFVVLTNPFAPDSPDESGSGYGLQAQPLQLAEYGAELAVTPASQSDVASQPCIIALERSARLSLNMYGSSSLVAPTCSVHSHSTSPFGVNLENVERLDVAAVYSGGSAGRTYESHGIKMFVDSNDRSNPLADVETPLADDCDHRDLILKAGDHLLQPGVYCGGIVSLTSRQIALSPGIYTIKNGPLAIGGSASFIGEGVSLVFDGPNAVFSFGVATKLALTAPTSGPMAGIVIFENPNSPKNREFVVRSHDAGLLEGAVYLPKGKFVVDSYGRVGQSSNWSAIIANQVEIINGASLYINSNHAASNVPLPDKLQNHQSLAIAAID